MIVKNNRGYTLIELVVSIAVGLIIIGAIYAAVNMGQRTTSKVERNVAAHQDARSALELMALEIQMASFNPLSITTDMWANPATCAAPSGSPDNRGIQQATATTITVEGDVTIEDGAINDANEIITYIYDAANERITRETNCGGNQAFLGDMPDKPRAVRVINNTVGISVFRYFDATGAEILAAGLPAGIPDIARIDITLVVETEAIDPDLGQRRRMMYSTSVIPRNHVI